MYVQRPMILCPQTAARYPGDHTRYRGSTALMTDQQPVAARRVPDQCANYQKPCAVSVSLCDDANSKRNASQNEAGDWVVVNVME